MTMYNLTGILTYSPKSHLSNYSKNDKWLILKCDDQLVNYYLTLFKREYPWLKKMQRPVWGAHISIIRGEKLLSNQDRWGFLNNQEIHFSYQSGVKNNQEYYWLSVESPQLEEVRKFYGLSPKPKYDFHLTVGRAT